MPCLHKTLSTWQTPDFDAVFKHEVAQLGVDELPLQQGLTQGSHASDRDLKVIIMATSETPDTIQVKAGIFYTGILPGCACSDDVAPDNEFTEYCEVLFEIDRKTAVTTINPVAG